jgi:catechol 2,3-dioxygenase-like lactoylglutathione lyase family enzyme
VASLVPFLHAADARASAGRWARLGFEVDGDHGFGAELPLAASDTPWGTREVELRDPAGNRVRVGSTAA